MATIITVTNSILRQKSKPIVSLDKKTLTIIDDLAKTIQSENKIRGVGLSAVQIGKTLRVFCFYLPPSGNPDDETQKPLLKTFINPEIIVASTNKTLGERVVKNNESETKGKHRRPILEGCLSIPGIWGPVWRHKWIKAKWQSKEGKWHEENLKDFPARVFQHELDHLNGILFTDYSLRDKLPLYESQDNELVKLEIA